MSVLDKLHKDNCAHIDDNSGAAWDMKENNAYLLPFDEED